MDDQCEGEVERGGGATRTESDLRLDLERRVGEEMLVGMKRDFLKDFLL